MALVTRPFEVQLRWPFRGQSARRGVLILGPSGWGEFSPFPEYGPRVAARWLGAALEAATGEWPRPLRRRIPVNVTVPEVGPETAYEIVAGSGCTTAKVKVGDPHDEERVEAVRDALGPRGRIRVDANGTWDVDRAAAKIRALSRYELEYVEQPVARLADMALLRKIVDVPLAADESVRTAPDPRRVHGLAEGADIVVLKVQPLGGVGAAMEVADAAGLPVVVSSAVETSVGIAAGLALAAALPRLDYACGLGTVSMLRDDVTTHPLLPEGGHIELRRPEVTEEDLARVAPGPTEGAALLKRMEAAEHELEERPQ